MAVIEMNDTTSESRASGARWPTAVVAGAIVSLPLGWLLSYGAALMALLGLFFFALFGLIIGAVMFRVAEPARPISPGKLKIGVAVVLMVCWSLSYLKEVYDFPFDKAERALRKVNNLPTGATRDSFQEDVRRFVRDTLENEYGGSGPVGYARWTLTSSRMEYPVETMNRPIVFRAVQYKWVWAVRIVCSIGLLWFGIHSQVRPLCGLKDPPGAANPPA